MPDKPQVTEDELRRMQAWLICLFDALAYIALARQKDEFVKSGAFFKLHGGKRPAQSEVGHTIEKGLIAAAIASAGQVFKCGGDGEGIAQNHTPNLKRLRDLLFECSDTANSFDQGVSAKIFQENVMYYRDKFVSHFDGKEANITSLDTESDAISWRPPNPCFRADSFGDLEKVLYQMHGSLRHFVTSQTIASKSSGASN
jgi:hypothetical protein